MMGYKDRTWCADKSCSKYLSCDRAVTDQVVKDATAWWGGFDFPIVMYATDANIKLDCYSPPATEVH